MSQSLKEINGKYYKPSDIVMLESKSFTTPYTTLKGEVLSVVKVGQIILNKDTNQLYINKNNAWSATADTDVLVPQELYFLSDEEIKKGDLFIHITPLGIKSTILKCVDIERRVVIANDNSFYPIEHNTLKKIIATTDESLKWKMIGFLPQPSPEFIQAFVEAYNSGKPITKVLIEHNKECTRPSFGNCDNYYDKDYKCDNSCIKLKLKDNQIICKKVEEKMYSENILKIYLGRIVSDLCEELEVAYPKQFFTNWIKQNLK